MFRINKSGQSGGSGMDGKGCGKPGTRGQNGTDGQHIIIVMHVQQESVVITEEPTKKQNFLVLGANESQIELIADGGKGGTGGDGAVGYDGSDGSSGRDASLDREAGDGQDGGTGGTGGRGGDGGCGGNGGHIKIIIDERDADLLMLFSNLSYEGGKGGSGGSGGPGGQGGRGGRGGRGGHFSDQYKSVSRSSGSRGRDGAKGRRGDHGMDGSNGQIGSLIYFVNGQQFFQMYDIAISSVEIPLSEDGIIEPGELLTISNLIVRNVGGMSTPPYQKIRFSIKNNEWVYFKPEFQSEITKWIAVGQVANIEKPLQLQIKDNIYPCVDSVYKQNIKYQFCATLDRVNKEFKTAAVMSQVQEVRFPVEITDIQYQKSITLLEEAPFAISVCNRSSQPIGWDTLKKRLLNFRLVLLDTRQIVEFIPKKVNDPEKNNRNKSDKALSARSQQNYINPDLRDEQIWMIDQEFIGQIEPNSVITISGTIKIKDQQLPPYAKVYLQAKLDLGYYHDQQNKFQNIQIRNLCIQHSEIYTYNPESDFLLIVNYNTNSNIILSIKQFAYQLGTSVDVWNISNRQGFSFDFMVSTQDKTLGELYKDKIVIIFSNEYEQTNKTKTNAIKQIRDYNIYRVAKDLGIRTYILGNTINPSDYEWLFKPVVFPQTSKEVSELPPDLSKLQASFKDKQNTKEDIENQMRGVGNYAQTSISFKPNKSNISCIDPEENHILEKSKEAIKKCNSMNLRYFHQAYYNFSPVFVKGNIFAKEYQLGNIVMVESLPKDQASIIVRKNASMNDYSIIDYKDKYNLLKLLPFETKFKYFERNVHNFENTKIILQTIISDLCDEFTIYKTLKKENTLELQKIMKFWNFILLYPFESQITDEVVMNRTFKYQSQFNQQVQSNIADTPQNDLSQLNQQPQNNIPITPQNEVQQTTPQEVQVQLNNTQQTSQDGSFSQMEKQNFSSITTESTNGSTLNVPLYQAQMSTNTKLNDGLKNLLRDSFIKLSFAINKQLSIFDLCCTSGNKKVIQHCQVIIETILAKKLKVQDTLRQNLYQSQEKANKGNKQQILFDQQAPIIKQSQSNMDFVTQNNYSITLEPKNFKKLPFQQLANHQRVVLNEQSEYEFYDPQTKGIDFKKRLEIIEKFEDNIVYSKD